MQLAVAVWDVEELFIRVLGARWRTRELHEAMLKIAVRLDVYLAILYLS